MKDRIRIPIHVTLDADLVTRIEILMQEMGEKNRSKMFESLLETGLMVTND
jgi:metal-responsive CopG/Arc/MetJ family transcriptional regulator